jgi:hypothetical protein
MARLSLRGLHGARRLCAAAVLHAAAAAVSRFAAGRGCAAAKLHLAAAFPSTTTHHHTCITHHG